MQLGVCDPVFRLPYTPLSKEARAEGLRIIKELGEENGLFFNLLKDTELTFLCFPVFNGDKAQLLDDSNFKLVANY